MKKLLLLAAAVLCAAISSSAQDYRELIKENPAMAGSNMMNYIYEPAAYTPAPKGYKPFYISHYGRHGSRYEGNDKSAAPVWKVMRAADSLGLLSEAGNYCRTHPRQHASAGPHRPLAGRRPSDRLRLPASSHSRCLPTQAPHIPPYRHPRRSR